MYTVRFYYFHTDWEYYDFLFKDNNEAIIFLYAGKPALGVTKITMYDRDMREILTR